MHAFAEKQKGTRQSPSAGFPLPGRTGSDSRPEVKSILHVQRTIGNHGVQRLLPGDAEGSLKGSDSPGKARLAHDFSRIPVHAHIHPVIQSKLKIASNGDLFEQEADRAAEQVMRSPGAASGTREQKEGSCGEIPCTEQTLSPQEKSFFESRFGHDFSQVRIHADGRSADMAEALKAEAFTFGSDIYFGAGRRARTGQAGRLLAHELAHVVQQSRIGPTLQPKLRLTGTTDLIARVVAVLNGSLRRFYNVSADTSGYVRIDPIRAAFTSSPTGPSAQEKALADRLWAMTTESGTTTVGVVAGGVPIVGSYDLSQIDIADIESLGSGQPGWNSAAALLHELVEQREKQLGATVARRGYGSPTTGAHGQGLAAELGMIGATLESDTGLVGATANADGTMNGSRTVVFKYPDGTRYRVEVTLSHNNITGVTRTKLP